MPMFLYLFHGFAKAFDSLISNKPNDIDLRFQHFCFLTGANGFLGSDDKKNKKKNKKKKKEFIDRDAPPQASVSSTNSSDMAEIQKLIEAKRSDLTRLQEKGPSGKDMEDGDRAEKDSVCLK